MPSIERRLFQNGMNRLFLYLFTRHYPRRPPQALGDFGESSKGGRADDADPCGPSCSAILILDPLEDSALIKMDVAVMVKVGNFSDPQRLM